MIILRIIEVDDSLVDRLEDGPINPPRLIRVKEMGVKVPKVPYYYLFIRVNANNMT